MLGWSASMSHRSSCVCLLSWDYSCISCVRLYKKISIFSKKYIAMKFVSLPSLSLPQDPPPPHTHTSYWVYWEIDAFRDDHLELGNLSRSLSSLQPVIAYVSSSRGGPCEIFPSTMPINWYWHYACFQRSTNDQHTEDKCLWSWTVKFKLLYLQWHLDIYDLDDITEEAERL